MAGAAYEVTWSPEPNVLRKISFSIGKYGEEEAFRRAVDYRQGIEKKVYGRVIQTKIPPFEEVKAQLDAQLAAKLKTEKAAARKKAAKPTTTSSKTKPKTSKS